MKGRNRTRRVENRGSELGYFALDDGPSGGKGGES